MEVCVVVTLNVRGNPKPYTDTIEKVGRKWVTLTGRHNRTTRFDIETHRLDGGDYSSPGAVYLNEAEYTDATCRAWAWGQLRSAVYNKCNVPEHLSLTDIEGIKALIAQEGE